MLLPEALQDWLPEGHLAYYISDTVDSLELGAFHARYAGGGPRNQPFHPAMMVKVLIYGYATGVFSSRKLARKLHEDVAFRVLAAGNFTAHRTLCDFRSSASTTAQTCSPESRIPVPTRQIRVFVSLTVSFSESMSSRIRCKASSALPRRHRITRSSA